MKPVPCAEGHKWCSGCSAELPFNSFAKNHRNRLGLDCYCRRCMSVRAKRFYKDRNAKRRLRKAHLVIEFGNKCLDCSVEDLPIDAYVFHHHSEPMTSPEYLIPSNVISLKNASVISREKAKWVLLCANCHSIRHGCKFTATLLLSQSLSL